MTDDATPGAEPLKEFLSEGEEIVEKLGRDLIVLDARLRRAEPGAEAPADVGAGGVESELLNDIFRGAHSLKGLAGMFGFRELTAVSHNLENLLDALRLGRVTLDASILDLLFAGLDLLGRQVKTAGASSPDGGVSGDGAEGAEIDVFVTRLNAVVGQARGAAAAAAAGLDPAILSVLTEFEEHRLDENLRAGRALYGARASFDLASFDQGLAELTARLKPLGELITTLPGSARSAPGRINFDIVIGSDQPIEAVRTAVEELDAEISALVASAEPSVPDARSAVHSRAPHEASLREGPVQTSEGEPGTRSRPGCPPTAGVPARYPPEGEGVGRAPRQLAAWGGSGGPPSSSLPGVGAAGAPPSAAAPVASPLAGAEAAAAGQAAPVADGGGEASLRSATQTVRVEIGRLDALMTIVGELALEKTVLAGIADHLKQAGGAPALASALTKASRSLEKRLTELQERVMEVRMVPLSQAFDKMARIVRKLSRDAGKEVDLVVSGADTKLDKLIVEEIVDPLMHITRNAIDRGIEPPGERQAAGKPVRGRIDLSAYQKGNHVVIEVADDGQGLDFDRVREVAVARGLLPDDGPPLNAREAFDLLCAPGFSTCDAVTEISGRGVGMDVVKTSIRRLSGVLDFETTRGRGTKMIITLPMTLAIIQALIVSGCGRTYAIPLNQVQENLMIAPGEIRTIDRREVIQLRERTLPIARLERLFRLSRPEGWRPGSSRGDGTLYVVVVGVGDLRMGLVVDELIGQQDVVVKSIGELLKAVRGIAGAADLGNQQTILVLDVGALIDEAIQLGAGRRGVG